jgi:hypothetical protein
MPDPHAHASAVEWKRGAQQVLMFSNSPSIRPTFRKDQQAADATLPPTQGLRDIRLQPSLAIHARDHVLQINQRRLELDHEQRSGRRVPREDVDRPALAVSGERDLRPSLPAGFREPGDNCLAKGGVSAIQEPIKVATAPPHAQIYTSVEGRCNAADRSQRESIEVAALDTRHGGL